MQLNEEEEEDPLHTTTRSSLDLVEQRKKKKVKRKKMRIMTQIQTPVHAILQEEEEDRKKNFLRGEVESPLFSEDQACIDMKGLKALSYLHSQQMNHRDVKASKVFFGEGGEAKFPGCETLWVDCRVHSSIRQMQRDAQKLEILCIGHHGNGVRCKT